MPKLRIFLKCIPTLFREILMSTWFLIYLSEKAILHSVSTFLLTTHALQLSSFFW